MHDAGRAAKAALRSEVLRRRDALPAGRQIEASLDIADRVSHLLSDYYPDIVGGYLPIRSEVDPRPLMAWFADRRARLAVPAIVGDHLEFRELVRGAALEPQGLGTHAPGPQADVLRPDILLVPLAAFDRRGHRVGYGRGFYDRAIGRLADDGKPLLLCGLAFAVQEVEAVPDDPFDRALDLVVTESEVIRPR